MALTKTPVNINFSQGVSTKTDPFQVPVGQFQSLVNSVFTTGGRLTKRNGYAPLPPVSNVSTLTTFQNALVGLGDVVASYNAPNQTWNDVANITPVVPTTIPAIRNSVNQTQCDSAVAPNGLLCVAYTEVSGSGTVYKYAVINATTGQTVLTPALLPNANVTYGTPRVFCVGTTFFILYTTEAASNYHLTFIAISSSSLVVSPAAADISVNYTAASTVAFDAAVLNNLLYVAYATSSGLKIATVGASLNPSVSVTLDAAHAPTQVSVTIDISNPYVWVTYYASGNTYAVATTQTLPATPFLAPVTLLTGTTTTNLTSTIIPQTAAPGELQVFYELPMTYGYDTNVATNAIYTVSCSITGTVSGSGPTITSVGLASKAFFLNGSAYFLAAYQNLFSPGTSYQNNGNYQPTYFLINGSTSTQTTPVIIAKLAYGNGGGYIPAGLPNPFVVGTEVYIAYLIKDSISAVNKGTALAAGTQVAGTYSQTGINIINYDFTDSLIRDVEIGNNLNFTGGYTYAYDGQQVTEQNFHLWPDNVEATWSTTVTTTTGTFAASSKTISLGSATGVYVGMTVADTTHTGYIQAGTTVTAISGTIITINLPTTSFGTGDTLSFTGNVASMPDSVYQNAYYYQVTYEWADNQGNLSRSAPSIPIAVTTVNSSTTGIITIQVPTLRLTSKINTPVNIVIYRWSAAQQIYYRVTSLPFPLQNTLSFNYVTWVDVLSDADILGNDILYTTGGVLEDIGPPAFSSMFLFDDRMWGIDAEDQNLLWFSKQVIETTPVEMSDLLTFYVAPTLGAQGSTGPLRCGFPMDDKAILFKDTAISYVNGTGPDNTGSNSQYSQPIFITSTVGCSSQESIVFTTNGLMFQFNSEYGNQIWLLGRDLSTSYIGSPVEAYTKNATVLSAVNIPGANHVLFTLSSGVVLLFDYFYNQWGTFLIGGNQTNTLMSPQSSTLYNKLHTYINANGNLYQESPGYYLDGSTPVLMSFTTSWVNIAGLQGYERFYQMLLLGTYISPFLLNVGFAYDYDGTIVDVNQVFPRNYNRSFGLQPGLFGQSGFGGNSYVFEERLFPTKQKCEAFQVSAQEIFDASYGTAAGAGLTLSGMNLIVGIKKGYRISSAAKTFSG